MNFRMMMALACLVLLCPNALPQAQPRVKPDDVEPPPIGQPANFSGAIGSFKIAALARPTELPAEGPLTFTIRITGTGRCKGPGQRPNLRRLPKFQGRFHIEDLPAQDGTRLAPGGQEWEYHYRLRPRSTEVTEIPALPFVYYKPGSVDPSKGYQTTYSESIPLQVRPRVQGTLLPSQGAVGDAPLRAPERIRRLSTGPALLEHEEAYQLPGLPALILLFLAAPVLCAAWYGTWRRLYPDGVRRLHLQRSRAARLALKALHGALGPEASARAKRTAAILASYLRQRLDLPAGEPTPVEAAAHLEGLGFSTGLAAEVGEFFRACDAARFAPDFNSARNDLPAAAERLILALEEFTGPRRLGPPYGNFPSAFSILFLSTIAALAVNSSETDAELLAGAEAAFREGLEPAGSPGREEKTAAARFRKSAELYEELRRRGAQNAPLFRNQGNAFLLADDLPQAILAYRRGLRLAPGDRDLRANLEHARDEVIYSAAGGLGRPPIEHWPPWLPQLPSWLRAGLAFLFYSLACLVGTRWLMTRRGRLLAGAAAAFVAAALSAVTVWIENRHIRLEEERPLAVLARDGTFLRKGNGALYPARYETPLNRGVEARLRCDPGDGDWLQIELAGGEVGWVPRAAVLLDEF